MFCSIHPYFTVVDEAAARPILADFVAKTRAESGCMWYGWNKLGDKLFCEEAYVDAAAVLAHLENIATCLEQMLDGPAKLDSIELHGPAAELQKLKESAEKIGATCFSVDSGFSSVAITGAPANPKTICSIHPYFTVVDEVAAKPIMDEFVEKTKAESGCLYYGWTKTTDNKLFCREAYIDGEAILAHLKSVGPLLEKVLAGPTKLDRLEFHGPAAELEKLKDTASSLGALCFATDSGFQKCERAG